MSKPKILIVDDSQLNREILSCMLEDKYNICEMIHLSMGEEKIKENADVFDKVEKLF